jgi:hypothetical protein
LVREIPEEKKTQKNKNWSGTTKVSNKGSLEPTMS